MRLRLIIQRQSLPPVQLLWTVGDVLSPFTPEPAATISQFLEQVNEIIPLESEDWGLEDYVVEVRSFECLHFSELSHIFREDDEVRVRPLQTSDLRFRKISGRHQISADGKHLIDGVAFGRPYLRRTDRPPIRIPPRKRRRITYDDDNNDIFDEHARYQQVAVHAGLDDRPNEESATDDDYSPDDEETDELFMELKDLRNDEVRNTGEAHFEVAEDPEIRSSPIGAIVSPRRLTRSRKAGGLCIEGEEMLKLVDENGRPYPGEYNNPLLDLYLYGDGEPRPRPDTHETKPNKRRRTSSLRGNVERATEESNIEPERVKRRNPKSSRKGVRFQDANLETPATVQELEESEQSGYEDFQPSSDMTPSQHESDKENSEPRYEAIELKATRNRKPSATSSASSEPESDDRDFSSHSSTASTSSDPSFKQLAFPSNVDAVAGASETSSGLSSDSDHPSLEVIKPPSAPQHIENVDVSETGSVGRLSPDLSDVDIKVTPIVSKFQAPYTGKVATRKRNQRRRDSKKLKRLKLRGLLSPNVTIEDYHRMQAKGVTAKEPSDDQNEKPQEEANNGHSAFEVKREYLLKAIASGGIDITHDAQQEYFSSQDMGDSAMVNETALDDGKKMAVDDRVEMPDRLERNSQTDQTPAGKSAHSSPDETAVSRDNATDLLDEINNSGETEAPPDGDKAAANQLITIDEVEVLPDYVITPNRSDAPADDNFNLPSEIAAEINVAVKSLQSPKRLRLDVSSSKRLVFGSLGVRAPKTKEDETNLTAKFMKDARPLQVFKPEDPSEASEPSVSQPNKNDNSWKDKIVLMAVECCEEGIELSTPPFPFVQRWDPQQKKKPKNVYNSRRDKKRKRNDDHYYIEMPGLSAGEDTCIWEPSASFGPEAPATGLLLEKQDQSTSRTENNEYENVSNEKSQVEADGSVPISADGGGIPDLPSLPDDMSACLSLTEATTMPGTIIAFKQLDMSKETNWQPNISDYRTAVVDCLKNNGTLRMILARRDQSKKEELYDQHTGERLYSKFEMPGFDEDAEKPGVLEISFSELIEPKLIQAANFQFAKQQLSTHDIDHSPPDLGTAMENNLPSSPVGSQPTDPELPGIIATEDRMVGVDEGVRQEIFDLIKEAGWRSSVRSNNEDDQRSEQNLPALPDQTFSQDQPGLEDSISHKEEDPNQGPSDQFNGVNSSPPYGKSLEPSDQRSSEKSLADSPQSQHVFEVAETVPVHRNTVPNTPTKNAFDNGDEVADVKEEDYEEGLMWSEPQYEPEADHQMSSQELSSQKPQPESVVRPVQHKGQNSKIVSSPAEPSTHDDVSSDNEFPTLENVFSQVRSSQAISSQGRPSLESRVSDDDLTYMAKSSFESTTTKGRDSQKGMTQNSESSGEDNLSQKQTLFKWEDSDEGDRATPRASQRPVQPQIVDLTLPSDPTDAPDDSDYIDDGTQLPVGPGWVQKTRATSSRLGSVRPGEGRSMRSRSRSVY